MTFTATPVRQLVQAHLRPMLNKNALAQSEFTFTVFDHAAPFGAEAVAGCGEGLDHHAGERVLAAMFDRSTPQGYEHRLVGAITDRRTIVSGYSSTKGGNNGTRFSLRHDAVARVDVKEGMLSNKVALMSAYGPAHDLTFGAATKALGGFYRALLGVPAAMRDVPPTPFGEPSEHDPSGAVAARHALWRDDPHVARLLDHVADRLRHGAIDLATARDFTVRLVLAHRSRVGGPGAWGGMWLSPLSAADLGTVLCWVFGRPAAHQMQDGYAFLDFPIVPGKDPLSAAAKALGIAAFVGLGIGLSPGRMIAAEMLRKQPIRGIRIAYADVQHGCTYRLGSPAVPLEQGEALMAHQLHQTLIAYAYTVLEHRCTHGWHVPLG